MAMGSVCLGLVSISRSKPWAPTVTMLVKGLVVPEGCAASSPGRHGALYRQCERDAQSPCLRVLWYNIWADPVPIRANPARNAVTKRLVNPSVAIPADDSDPTFKLRAPSSTKGLSRNEDQPALLRPRTRPPNRSATALSRSARTCE